MNIWVSIIITIQQRVLFLEFWCLILLFVIANYSPCSVESLLEHLLICVSKWMSHGRTLSRKFLPWIKKSKFWIPCRAKQNCSGEIFIIPYTLTFAYNCFSCDCPKLFRLGCTFWVQSLFSHSIWCADISIFPYQVVFLFITYFPMYRWQSFKSSVSQNTFSFLFFVCWNYSSFPFIKTYSLLLLQTPSGYHEIMQKVSPSPLYTVVWCFSSPCEGRQEEFFKHFLCTLRSLWSCDQDLSLNLKA